MNKKLVVLICVLSLWIIVGALFLFPIKSEKIEEIEEIEIESEIVSGGKAEYNPEERMMTIYDPADEEKTLTKVKLLSEDIMKVIPGKDRKVAEFEIDNLELKYDTVFKKLEFYDMNENMRELDRKFTYKYKKSLGFGTVINYKTFCDENGENCERISNGEHEEERFEWVEIKDTDPLPTGKITIGIFADVYPGDHVEWIPTIHYVRIEQWAQWTSSLSDQIISYHTMDSNGSDELYRLNLTGSATHSLSNGIIGGYYNFTGEANSDLNSTTHPYLQFYKNFSISFWANITSIPAGGYLFTVVNGSNPGGTNDYTVRMYNHGDRLESCLRFDNGVETCRQAGVGTLENFESWQHISLVYNGINMTVYINGSRYENTTVSNDFSAQWNSGAFLRLGADAVSGGQGYASLDEFAIWNRSLSFSEVSDLYNGGTGIQYTETTIDVSLVAPTDNSKQLGTSVEFNATLTPTRVNITNATIYIWNSTDSVVFRNTTDLNNASIETKVNWSDVSFLLGETYRWNVDAYGTNDIIYRTNSNNTFTATSFTEISQTYNSSILETSSQTFSQTIDVISNVTSASVVFWYDGSSYAAPVTESATDRYNTTSMIDIPLTDSTGNKTFLWEWSFTTTSQTSKENSTVFSHQVNRSNLTVCDAVLKTQTINFTTKNATNPYPILNSTFKIAIDHWFGGGSVYRNYSYENISEVNHSYAFCIQDNETYNTNAIIEYDGIYSALNFYYLTDASLSNATQSIDLYLLDNGLSTLTELETVDRSRNAVANITIQIQSYDVGTDTYYTVAMAKTSDLGGDLAYLNWYDTLYKFILIQNGSIVKSTSPYKISETPQTFEILDEAIFSFKKFENFDYDLYFNDTTSNFVFTFTKPSGEVNSACLRVTKRNITEDTQICLTCETSTSATLYCNIAGYGNGTYIASIYATGSLKWMDILFETAGEVRGEVYNTLGNLDGTVIAIIFAGIVLTFFLISPVVGIIGAIIGMLGAVALGFQPANLYSFLSIVFVGGIIIWLIRK